MFHAISLAYIVTQSHRAKSCISDYRLPFPPHINSHTGWF
nr:MAG TPA: hypothetical protein [Bacteriophage sp.]